MRAIARSWWMVVLPLAIGSTAWAAADDLLMTPEQPAEGSTPDLTGCWQGGWESCVNGHDGKLRATITQLDDQRYCAEFTGTFWYVFPFRYRVALDTVDEEQGATVLRGTSDLGLLGGTFSYEATVTDTHFHATYTSCNDHGYFCMQRRNVLEPCCCDE
jgi:hypothetical protein